MLTIKAKIHLRTEYEGGLTRAAFSGMQPSFGLNDDLVACKIIFGDDNTPMPLGNDYHVLIELPYGELFQDKLKPGYQLNVNVASRIIGDGEILEISDPRAPSDAPTKAVE